MFHPSRSGVGARCIQLLMHLLACLLPTLSTHLDANFFKNARGPVTITRCKSALHSTAWAWQFHFVLWFTTWICGIQRWGRGCACHSDETECKWKGRRLPEAAVFVDQEAESWTKDTFQTTVSEPLDLVRCVRASYHMVGTKFAYLQEFPWLIVRIFEPGVKKECLHHWSACAPREHHRCTRCCLDPSQLLRSDLGDSTDDCSKAPPSLLAAVASLAALPMDDSIVEFSHAMASRLVKSGRATKFPSLASSMRLKQSLTTVRELGSAVSADLRLEWSSCTSLL